MDAMQELTSKSLSIKESRRLIHKFITDSSVETIENFWLIEMDNLHLTKNDSNFYMKILEKKNDKSEASIAIYKRCLNENIIVELLKKNWRRFLNNDIIEKYEQYKKKNKIP